MTSPADAMFIWTKGLLAEVGAEGKLSPPASAAVLMALLGIALLGLFLIVVVLLGGNWVRKQGTHRRGPSVPPDRTPLRTRADEPPALDTTLGVKSHFSQSGARHAQRLVPGAPLASVLYQRIGSRFPATQMPPLGTNAVDAEALALVRDWIREDLALHVAAADLNTGER